MSGTEVALLALGLFALGGGAHAARSAARSMRRSTPPDRRRMTKAEIQALAEMVGFPDSTIAAAIALAESGGHPEALGDEGKSIGLWQIYTTAHPQYARDDLLDPLKNAHAAFKISEGGKNWRPWTTYRNGAYKTYL